jgi:hypothetical protein
MIRLLSVALVAVVFGVVSSVSAHDQHSQSNSSPAPIILAQGPDAGLFRGPAAGDQASRVQSQTIDTLPPTVSRRRVLQIDGTYLQTRVMPRIASPSGAPDQPKQIQTTPDAVRLNLFADAAVDAVLEKFQHTQSGDLVWQGRPAGDEKGMVHLVISRGRITGAVTAGGITYSIYPDKDGNTVIDQIDQAGFPKAGPHPTREVLPGDKPVLTPQWMAPADGPSIVGDPNTMTTVTLLVAYTQAAASQSADILSEINLAVAMANTAYTNSGVNITLQLVGTVAATYNEGSKSAGTVVTEARQGMNGSGELSELYTARRAYGADVVALIVKDYSAFQACGVAYMLLNPTTSDAPWAVSASMRGSCISNHVLSHEVGHNMGLAHDRYAVDKYNESPWNGNLPQNYDYFGYVDVGARELTVMSYYDACRDVGVNTCSRVARISNPTRTFTNGAASGIALGQSNPANNARVLNVNKDIVAQWRPVDPGGPVLTVAKSGTGSGSVTSSPSGISCGSTCLATFTSGQSVTLTASASSGSVFSGWSGACSGSAATASVVMSATASCTATFTLNTVVTRPANDNFDAATVITGTSGTATGSNVDATEEVFEPNHAGNRGGKSVWWSWTPAASGSVIITTTGSSFDTLLAAYTGSSVGLLTLVAANDDAGRTRQSSISFNATAGQTYRIVVDGYNGASGSVALNWTETFGSAPANDAFASAIALTRASGTASGSNRFATKETGEPAHAGNSGSASVWWSITPTRSRKIRLNTAGSNFDTTLAVYTGSSVAALTAVVSNDDRGNTLQSAVSFNATAGTTYYIAVDGHGSATGSIVLSYSGGPSTSHQVENGWWWSPSQPGSGIAIEQSGDQLFVGAYLYDSAGRAVWYAAMGALSGTSFNGQLVEYANGQTLRGSYRSPSVRRMVGTMTIDFTGDTTATITWPGGTMAIERFNIVSGGSAEGSADGDPETGWWWSESESGRGYFIETQGSGRTLYLGGYMYDADGAPVWYIAGGGLQAGATVGSGLSHTGPFSEYANGQWLGGPWRAPDVAGPRGTITVQFVSAREAILTLPDGQQVTLTRFVF